VYLREATTDQIVQIAPFSRAHAGANVQRAIDRASKTGSTLEHHRKLARDLRHGDKSPHDETAFDEA
jgi:hypothetical protein